MTKNDGIIDEARNPFTETYWVNQGYGLTPKRSRQIEDNKLIGKAVDEIKAIKKRNVGAYLAFVAVR